ncbi:MAG TPA: phosphoribosylaminoimidazolesuccinocarboxamide synthase [Candidatus Saccharimonadia bacterium]
MVNATTILAQRDKALLDTDFPFLGIRQQGKVRDFYSYNGQRITITTDRQSAFDQVLGLIPFKGSVLNELAAWWFHKTRHIIPNHMIATPDPNVLISDDCQAVPVEIIVRGYLSGATKTAIWSSYSQGERTIYGLEFPDGMVKNQKLPNPVITPTTHATGGSHDERLTREQIIGKDMVPKEIYEEMERVSLELFRVGQLEALKHELILVDTKYEFGVVDGKLLLIDEIHTPDSSRFWKADSYQERIEVGMEPENFDKEFLRLWYVERGYSGEGQPPHMTPELVVQVAQRYMMLYEMLTGETFEAYEYPINGRIEAAIKRELNV